MTEPSISGQTPDPRGWTGALADAAWGLLGAAAVLAFLAVWVVVPAPVSALLAFGVMAPELSPALSPVALAVAGGAWMVRVRRPARPAAVLALAAAIVFALPLLQRPAAESVH